MPTGKNRTTTHSVTIGFLILTVLVGVVVYGNSMDAPFIYDGKGKILENPRIRMTELTGDSVSNAVFRKSKTDGRTLTTLSYAINYYFHGYDLWGYHFVNILIHLITGGLLYIFIVCTLRYLPETARIDDPLLIAAAASLLWMVIPLHTQTVTYIVQRANGLATMLFMLSLVLYLQGREARRRSAKSSSWRWFLAAAVVWILSLGCKQITITLPVVVLLYEWFFFRDLDRQWMQDKLKYLTVVLVLLILMGLFFLLPNPLERLTSIKSFSENNFAYWERVLTQPRVVLYYASLIFWPLPSRLRMVYDWQLSASLFTLVTTILAVGGIIALLFFAFKLARKERLISFCILWFFGNLAVESSFIPLEVIVEHRTYLPSMLVWLIPVLLVNRYAGIKWIAVILFGAVAVLFSYWTMERNEIWRDPIAFWQDNIQKAPGNPISYNNLALELVERDRNDEAIGYYEKAIAVKPGYAKAHFNIGKCLQDKGDLDAAIRHYRSAVENNPKYANAVNNLAGALLESGRIDEALSYFIAAVALSPDDAQIRYNLATIYAMQGANTNAIIQFEEAIRLHPGFAPAHANLATVYANRGEYDKAAFHYQMAFQYDPKLPGIRENLKRLEYYRKKL